MTAAIKCSHSEVWPLAKFQPHARNPNTHSDEQIRLLGKVIVAQGWRSPVCVSKRSGLVIKGHGRLKAAQAAGLDSAPVDLQDYADEAGELADLIADNRISELAEMDLSALKDVLEGVDSGAVDMEVFGFTDAALAQLMTQIHLPDEPEEDASSAKRVKCPKCGHKFATA